MILFFDGVCNLCNGFVSFLIAFKPKKLKFASLQGNTAKTKLPSSLHTSLNTVVLYKEGQIYTQSDAVIRVLADLHILAKVLYLGLLLPKSIRDFLYDWVAQNRYRWFGQRQECRLPKPSEHHFFLD